MTEVGVAGVVRGRKVPERGRYGIGVEVQYDLLDGRATVLYKRHLVEGYVCVA